MTKQNKHTSMPTLTVQGKPVNNTIIAAYAKRVGSLDDVLSVWSNAAALQMAVHGNNKWMVQLFEMPVLTLKAGGMSKAGKEVFEYIQAHFPRLNYDKEKGTFGLTKLVKESILATHFAAPEVTEPREGLEQVRAKFFKPHGDFLMTFTEWRNRDKPQKEDKEETAPQMSAKTFAKTAEKALECLKNERFVGTSEELFAAASHAKALFMQLDALHTAAEAAKLAKMQLAGTAHTADDAIDVETLSKSLSVKPSSKAKAAA